MIFLQVCAGIALIIMAIGFCLGGCVMIAVRLDKPASQEAIPEYAWLVIDGDDPGAGLLKSTLNGPRALEYAQHTNSVVVRVPLAADYRVPVDFQG